VDEQFHQLPFMIGCAVAGSVFCCHNRCLVFVKDYYLKLVRLKKSLKKAYVIRISLFYFRRSGGWYLAPFVPAVFVVQVAAFAVLVFAVLILIQVSATSGVLCTTVLIFAVA